MSNSIGQNLLHQSLLPSTVLEHQSKTNSACIAGKTLFQAQATLQIRNSPLSTKFLGNRLNVRKTTMSMGNRMVSVLTKAVLATETASELGRKFNLDGNIELQVTIRTPAAGSVSQVDFQVTNSNDSLTLHWGGIRNKKEKWVLPNRRPDGTKVYKERALRTPLTKSGSNAFLSIEIDDPEIQALEFLIVDEARNKWFKHNGDNFHIKLPQKEKRSPNVSVPEDLVQIQAYLRWERNGKQTYTPEQEKEEFEAARSELLKEIARGSSIEDLRARLTNKSEIKKRKELALSEMKRNLTDDLVQTQAYIRWEKAGKPKYSANKQREEYEAARAELLKEIARGSSIEDLRARLTNKNEIKKSKELILSENKSNLTDDLVRTQAYIRWEKAGKPKYSANKQLEEYKAARAELLEEIARGSSIEDLQARLTNKKQIKESKQLPSSEMRSKLTDDLVLKQAYIRWEKAGKPQYSANKQREEYEAARAELLKEIATGSSIEDLRARLTNKNEIKKSKELPLSKKKSNLTDDLVQTQAYIRWEKAGRPQYSANKQREEYEAARAELLKEIARGSSIEDLRARLTNKNETKESKQLPLSGTNSKLTDNPEKKQAFKRREKSEKPQYSADKQHEEYEATRAELLEKITRDIPIEDPGARLTNKNETIESKELPLFEKKSKLTDDLVQKQAYIRWEKAGKPLYSAAKQLSEFEEARKELQAELEKGMSVDDIRKKITKGEVKTQDSPKKQEKRGQFNLDRIQRKKRDPVQLLNKYDKISAKATDKTLTKPKTLSTVELFAKEKEEQSDVPILNGKIYKLGDKELLVLVTKPSGKTRVHLATNLNEPAIIHWALSKQGGEWLEPPPSTYPSGSISVNKAVETPFCSISSGDPSYKVQSLEIEVDDDTFVGMPFVILSGGNWIKDNGSDFYIKFGVESKKVKKDYGDGKGTAKALLDRIADMESEAQKSFMHRFNIAADLTEEAKNAGELGLAGILVWMRFMATRQLIWNKNYNVKPREISQAQDRLTDLLQKVYESSPSYRELVRMILSTVGRGGEGDVGQRIRDEILVIQSKNACKGGMMEEWHQKLHNNTSPDDVVICQALIDYIKSDFDISVYWKTLNENGIDKKRLLSYDRAIRNEPNFSSNQKDGLLRDLGNYMRTLKAVHSGADLESAVSNCMGYKSRGEGFMVGVNINPVSGLPSEFPNLLQFILQHVEDKNVEALLEGLLEAREELRPSLSKPNDRLKDLLFLDIALDSTVRTAIERSYEELNTAKPEKIMYFISLLLENLALSSDDNEDLIYCLKGWNQALNLSKSGDHHWALFAKSVLDRTRLALTTKAEWFQQLLQPSAEYLGSQLGVDESAVNIFTEEIIRSGSAASLSSLLNRLDPILRSTANLGSWQVICPVEAVGYVVVVNELLAVQNETYEKPTILVAKNVRGEEEIPDGAVAVLTPDMPDVLSHVSVRARNSKVCFATCFDPNILADLQAKEGKLLQLKPTSADVVYSEVKESDLTSSTNVEEDGLSRPLTLVKKKFVGKYAISSDEFTNEMVGAKSRNIAYLKGKVPSSVGIPTSVALPFGVFEKVLSDNLNQGVAQKVQLLQKKLEEGEYSVLGQIRKTVLELAAPPQLVEELKSKMQGSGMPWPGDEGQQRWEQAWLAIKKVWASKWNERAYFSTRKVKLDHNLLCMAVLVQEIINADYAFVIHTTNPSSGDSTEIYAEVVKGLGETLVGAYPGRALSFICKKSDLSSPQVLGYPSKPIGLFIRRSIIFRSDSNGEDLEGYAGAGLYDSVPMDEEEKVVLDYSSDPLINDNKFQKSILSSIALAGKAIEDLYGSAQDIEGVVRDGKIYVVQTRPQM